MEIKVRQTLFVFIFIVLPTTGFAQKGIEDGSKYGHGDDSIHCIKHLSIYREFAKHQDYNDALHSWRLVFNECPRSTQNIYIDGAKMYNDFIELAEDNPARQDALIDTLMMIYDQRIKYFKQKGSVLGRKGVDLMRYRREDPEKLEESYGYLKESVTILGNKSSAPIIATFMLACYGLYEKEMISNMQVIEDYSMVSDIIDYQLAEQPDDADMSKVKEYVDLNFIASGAPTCESLITYFKGKYDEKKEEVSFLRKAVTFMGTLDCERDPFYTKAAEDLYNKEPSAQAAFSLAKLFVMRENYNKAYQYYKEAVDKEKDPEQKADYYYQLGVITNSKLDKPQEARTYGLEAINLNPSWGEPYILIGDTYVASKNCFDDDFEKTTIYWVAVDKFVRAKSVDQAVAEKADERISTYSKYFPNVETIFFYSLKEGDQYTVGCWINEKTTVRSK